MCIRDSTNCAIGPKKATQPILKATHRRHAWLASALGSPSQGWSSGRAERCLAAARLRVRSSTRRSREWGPSMDPTSANSANRRWPSLKTTNFKKNPANEFFTSTSLKDMYFLCLAFGIHVQPKLESEITLLQSFYSMKAPVQEPAKCIFQRKNFSSNHSLHGNSVHLTKY